MADNSFAKGQAMWNPFGGKKKDRRKSSDESGYGKAKSKGKHKVRKPAKGRHTKGKGKVAVKPGSPGYQNPNAPAQPGKGQPAKKKP